MTGHEYDEEASEWLHMDVVHDTDDISPSTARWVDAMRRLNVINDPLARSILALHRDCGSGSGECDSELDAPTLAGGSDWGCETTALIAAHYGVEFNVSNRSQD